MTELSNIDYCCLEPQPRGRSRTWPLKRPTGCTKKMSTRNNLFQAVEPTLEKPIFTDESISDNISSFSAIPEHDLQEKNENGFANFGLYVSTDIDSNAASKVSLKEQVTEYTSDFSQILNPKKKRTLASNNLNDNFVKLETISQENLFTTNYNFDNSLSESIQNTSESNLRFINNLSNTSDQQTIILASNTSQVRTSSNASTCKPKSSSRKNAWGNSRYADLITQAIESSQEKRLTLAEIYDWVVKNIDYFKDKGNDNSSASWKNSIRHNLSLHNKFKRVQNEGAGKSSWWIINYDAKPRKPRTPRPPFKCRSMPSNSRTMKAARNKALMKTNELMKIKKLKKKSNLNEEDLVDHDWSHDFPSYSDFRHRTNSDASSTGSRTSPNKSHLLSDLEPDGPTTMSPTGLSSSYTAPNVFDFIGRNGDFDITDKADWMANHEKLLEPLENMDILPVSPPKPEQANDGASVFCNRTTSAQPHQHMKDTCNSSAISADDAMSRPTTSLLQNQTDQGSANTEFQHVTPHKPRFQPRTPQHNQSQQVFGQQQFSDGNVYTLVQQVTFNNQQPPTMTSPEQQNFARTSTVSENRIISQLQMMGQVATQPVDGTNMASNSEYPSDLDNLNKSDIFNPGSFDITDLSQYTNLFGKDFSSCFPQENIDLYNMNNTADSSSMSSGFESSDFSTPQYPANPQSLMSGSRSSSSEQATQLENSTPIESCQSQIFTVLNAPLNGALQSNITRYLGNGRGDFSNRFGHSHPVTMEQLSQGVGTEFYMR